VLVPVGDHRPAPVPPAVADDDDLAGEEGVGRADDRADVQVVPPVLDGDRERMTPGVQVGDDRLDGPVAVAVDDVAAVTVAQQLAVEARVLRPRQRVRADADFDRMGRRSPGIGRSGVGRSGVRRSVGRSVVGRSGVGRSGQDRPRSARE
jgi:hypothetical protein